MKYNRTYHLPWSEGATNDDCIASSINGIVNVPIVISEKLDGSNVCLENNHCFARSHSGPPNHSSFDAFKALHSSVKYLIPNDYQLFGEWLYAVHSIKYEALPHYLALFGIRDKSSLQWLSWDDVVLWAEEIKVPTVPVLFIGKVSNENELYDLTMSLMKQKSCYEGDREGLVVRLKDNFADKDFDKYIFKFVRKNHVQTSEHWKHKTIIKNNLKL